MDSHFISHQFESTPSCNMENVMEQQRGEATTVYMLIIFSRVTHVALPNVQPRP